MAEKVKIDYKAKKDNKQPEKQKEKTGSKLKL